MGVRLNPDSDRLADKRQIALLAMKCSFLCGLSLILTVVPLHATAAIGASATEVRPHHSSTVAERAVCSLRPWSYRWPLSPPFESRSYQLGQLYSFVTLLCLFISPLAGVLADRIGRRPLAIGGALATALSIAAVPLVNSKPLYCLARATWAAGEALLITAYSALALDVTPEAQRGARNSLDNQVSDVALLFLPLTLGVVGSKSIQAAFWLGSALMLGANFIVSRISFKENEK